MDQQRSAIVKYIYIKYSNCPPLALTRDLSLQRSRLINDRLLDASLTIAANRPAPVALPGFCNPRTKVWDVRKPPVRCYD